MPEKNGSPYKYSCRKCPIRNRCIEYSDSAPTIKAQIRNAFANKTDTIDLWAHLQSNCLLVKADEEAKKGSTESLLSQRLRRARENRTGELPPPAPPPTPKKPTFSPPPPPKPLTPFIKASQPDENLPDDIRDPDQVTRHEIASARASGQRFWLTVQPNGRHITLPVDGSLVLGRYDPHFGIPPDVDLTFEDAAYDSVSRRHARITGKGGIHFIEEMGGRAGIVINGKKLGLGATHRLYEGDIITLGHISLRYSLIPGWIFRLGSKAVTHVFTVAATGETIVVPPGERIIGRSDRFINYQADIDLSHLGAISQKVSRRHALLSQPMGLSRLYIEDMGSGFGTKINGELIMMGKAYPLTPGDHIWLGGCVLAYDVQI